VKNICRDGVEKRVVVVVDGMVIKNPGGAFGPAAPGSLAPAPGGRGRELILVAQWSHQAGQWRVKIAVGRCFAQPVLSREPCCMTVLPMLHSSRRLPLDSGAAASQ